MSKRRRGMSAQEKRETMLAIMFDSVRVRGSVHGCEACGSSVCDRGMCVWAWVCVGGCVCGVVLRCVCVRVGVGRVRWLWPVAVGCGRWPWPVAGSRWPCGPAVCGFPAGGNACVRAAV